MDARSHEAEGEANSRLASLIRVQTSILRTDLEFEAHCRQGNQLAKTSIGFAARARVIFAGSMFLLLGTPTSRSTGPGDSIGVPP